MAVMIYIADGFHLLLSLVIGDCFNAVNMNGVSHFQLISRISLVVSLITDSCPINKGKYMVISNFHLPRSK